jgi:hypothetical protein
MGLRTARKSQCETERGWEEEGGRESEIGATPNSMIHTEAGESQSVQPHRGREMGVETRQAVVTLSSEAQL